MKLGKPSPASTSPPTAPGRWHLEIVKGEVLATVFTSSDGVERMRFGLLGHTAKEITYVHGPWISHQPLHPGAIYEIPDNLGNSECT